MKKQLFTLAGIALSIAAFAQQYPDGEPMTPGMTEFWNPQPKVVTPGNQATCSAPSDAIILFDGTNLNSWHTVGTDEPAHWDLRDGEIVVNKKYSDIETNEKFGSFQLHIEWKVPKGITGESQARGNSGVYLQGMYEIQILDTYNNVTYCNGTTGSIYKQVIPLANAMRAPGEWNVYDIIYNAPVFNEDGTYKCNPTVTLLQNGILLLNNFVIRGTTEYVGHPKVIKHGDGPIRLQSHGDPSEPISFRNIWIRKL